ncbi:dihydrodipicolinate reductase [Tabrizicola sp. J26]|uniref:dihydrodipicolinate reductase n=1 Tax=Alitabrizicola rongguiensis TaxID=2909234 RepID=UPI001F450BF5|nr:dihydrodipicolinate reductase [Tabrizicola rongguiensis]MCF1707841.1 dihydrodipicolinate reductase [Tabrizicola rongguiensis]
MGRLAFALLLVLVSALPVRADTFSPVRDREQFLSIISGKTLELPLFRIRLEVRPDGRIEGSALGWEVTGSWNWQDGYFCRDMDWSGTPIAHNCQLVEAKGSQQVRFTVDRGEGESASFRLR